MKKVAGKAPMSSTVKCFIKDRDNARTLFVKVLEQRLTGSHASIEVNGKALRSEQNVFVMRNRTGELNRS